MSNYLGDFPASAIVYVPFNTFDSNGASVIISDFVAADIAVYKDGSTTQRASTSGFTLLDTDGINFDGVTGIHGFKIDLSDDTDAGFYAAGHEYMVVVGPITVDAQTVNFVAAEFSIERAGGALALLKSATYGLSAIEALVDDLESRLTAARAGYLDVLQYLPSVTAGAAGGLFIAGTNAAVTITSAAGDALTISSTGANGDGVQISGNGTGAGVNIDAGATGIGVDIAGGATSGTGLNIATTDGDGIASTAAGAGHVDVNADLTVTALADDVITSDTFDETTAFPQTTADVGGMVLP